MQEILHEANIDGSILELLTNLRDDDIHQSILQPVGDVDRWKGASKIAYGDVPMRSIPIKISSPNQGTIDTHGKTGWGLDTFRLIEKICLFPSSAKLPN